MSPVGAARAGVEAAAARAAAAAVTASARSARRGGTDTSGIVWLPTGRARARGHRGRPSTDVGADGSHTSMNMKEITADTLSWRYGSGGCRTGRRPGEAG